MRDERVKETKPMTQRKYDEHDIAVARDIAELTTKVELMQVQVQNGDKKLDDLTEKVVLSQMTNAKVLEILERPKLFEKMVVGVGGFIDRNWKTIVLIVITGGGAAAMQALH